MSADIGPGDFVECVDASTNPRVGVPPPISEGAIYQVERVSDDALGLWLVGIASHADNGGFWLDRFKPIYRPKPDAFTDLLKVPDRKRVTA